MNDNQPSSPRRRRRIIGGIGLIVVGLVLFPGLFIALMGSFFLNLMDGHQVPAPGETTIHLAEPGAYTIYHETRGVFNGHVHITPSFPAGMQIAVRDDRSGNDIPVSSSTSGRITMGSTERRSLATFNVQQPGDYTIVAHGSDQNAVLFIAPDMLAPMMAMIVTVSCSSILGLAAIIGGIVLLILGFLTPKAARLTPADTPSPAL